MSWALAAGTAHGADAGIASPDGRSLLRIADDGATFSVTRRGETVIAASPLGLELDGAPALAALTLDKRDDVAIDRTIPLVATKAAAPATATVARRSPSAKPAADAVSSSMPAPTTTASPSATASKTPAR